MSFSRLAAAAALSILAPSVPPFLSPHRNQSPSPSAASASRRSRSACAPGSR